MRTDDNRVPRVPWLSYKAISAAAEEFLARSHPGGALPIPVEMIIEQLGVDIVPLPGLRANYEIEGFTTGDLSTIFVDQGISETTEHRYRFTLAHELGHIALHNEIFRQYGSCVARVSDWIEMVRSFTDDEYSRLEFQAYCFGGLVLVPKASLLSEFDRALPSVRLLIDRAVRQGIPRQSTLELAWDELAVLLSRPFDVSSDVIQRRLKFEGLSAERL